MRERPRENVKDVWESGGAYESFMGRWSRLVAEEFLQWLSVPAGSTWLDAGCGTGVLSRAILEYAEPLKVRGIDLASGFVSFATNHIHDPRATFEVGSAESFKVESTSCDAVVSGLVLNFVPKAERVVSEMKRVTKPGGVVGAYVWDYAGRMEILRRFWNAAVALDSRAAVLDEGKRFPLCNPKTLKALFISQELHDVHVGPIDVRTHFVDFQDYWTPFLAGQGPAPSYVASLSKHRQSKLERRVLSDLPVSPDGAIDLTARAWAVKGYV